jgi:hypothetical protein
MWARIHAAQVWWLGTSYKFYEVVASERLWHDLTPKLKDGREEE